jgi:hypothetical protein
VVVASAEPMSQATSSIASTLTSAPPVASRARAGDQVMCWRNRLPRWVVTAWPAEAQTITTTTAARAPAVPGPAPAATPSHTAGSA